MTNSEQHIDDILKNIREIMDGKDKQKQPIDDINEDQEKKDCDIVELSNPLNEDQNQTTTNQIKKNEIYVKDEDGTESHNEQKSVINLTKQIVVADVSSKINEFLTKVHEVNKEKKENLGLDLQDLVSSLIIPYLADWLNKNLPQMVDEILKREIRKLIDN